jgi:hypothetical protein
MPGRKLKKDIMINLVFAGLKIITLMWVIRLAGINFLPTTLGLFLMARRLSSTGACLFQIGMSQTLLRYISANIGNAEVKLNFSLFALIAWMGGATIFSPVFYVAREFLASWFFPNSAGNGAFAFWTGMLLLAQVLGFVVQSILVAERRMVIANLVELTNVSLFLLIALFVGGKDLTPHRVIQFQTSGIVFLCLCVLVTYIIKLRVAFWPDHREMGVTGRIFLRYGLPRGVITFLDMLILLIGPWLIRAESDEAGFLIIALMLVRILQMAISPIVQVTAVVIARFVGQKDYGSIGMGVQLMFGTVLYATSLAMATIIPWSDLLIRLWLTDVRVVEGVLPYFSTLLWGIFPFTIFHGLKGFIEMRWFKPLNLYTLLIGIGIQFLVYRLTETNLSAVLAARISVLAGFWVMGIMTFVWIRSYLQPFSYLGIGNLFIVSLALAVINFFFTTKVGLTALPFALALSVMLLVIVFRFVLPTPFVHSFLAFILSRSSQRG